MWKQGKKKLTSKKGASLMVALLIFMVCAMVGSVILSAAATSMGRASSADTSANKQRYSLESAANLIVHEVLGDEENDQHMFGVSFQQTWYFHLATADYVVSGAGTPLTSLSNYITTSNGLSSATLYNSYETNPTPELIYGDYVLSLDQDKVTPHDDSNLAEQIKSGGAGREKDAEEKYAWNYDPESKQTVYWTKTVGEANKQRKSVVTDISSFNSNPTSNSLQDIVCYLEYQMLRKYWDTIINSGQTSADPDPLNAPVQNWSEIVKKGGNYSIGTKDALTVDLIGISGSTATDETCPVYADLELDQDGILSIHLYCTEDNNKSSSVTESLYLTFTPDEGPNLVFHSEPTVTTESCDPIL